MASRAASTFTAWTTGFIADTVATCSPARNMPDGVTSRKAYPASLANMPMHVGNVARSEHFLLV